jgi:hypothetical protein
MEGMDIKAGIAETNKGKKVILVIRNAGLADGEAGPCTIQMILEPEQAANLAASLDTLATMAKTGLYVPHTPADGVVKAS